MNKNWKVTDPDTNQQGRQLSNTRFEFKEDGKEQKVIDISTFSQKQVESTINAYGYTLYGDKEGSTNIDKLYGKDSDWIIAECLFEMDM